MGGQEVMPPHVPEIVFPFAGCVTLTVAETPGQSELVSDTPHVTVASALRIAARTSVAIASLPNNPPRKRVTFPFIDLGNENLTKSDDQGTPPVTRVKTPARSDMSTHADRNRFVPRRGVFADG